MKVCGIIAEFNPFHNGHKLLIDQARNYGASHIVAVMSGNFVQRGSAAIADKHTRTAAALAGGVDVVIDLPIVYSCGSAQLFAGGAVSILKATSLIDMLAFGSESGDINSLSTLAREITREINREINSKIDGNTNWFLLKKHLATGMTFAKARQNAMAEILDSQIAEMLSKPNNILGVEYLSAAQRLGWKPEFFTIPRQGAAHDSETVGEKTASASFLRKSPLDLELLSGFIPIESVAVLKAAEEKGLYPSSFDRLDLAVLSKLRLLDKNHLSLLPDISEGLENRFYNAIRQAVSVEELYRLLKTKRYPLSRIRRLVLHAFLGICSADTKLPPPYIRILGFTGRGKELVAKLKTTAQLPYGTSLLKLANTSAAARRLCELENNATDLFALSLPRPRPCGFEMRSSVVKG